MGRSTGCGSHRAELIAFAECGEHGPRTAEAFDHLARCRRCETELTEIVLAVHAVRRTLSEAARVDPPVEAWDRLRARVQRPVVNVWRARTSLAGVIMGAGLVAALVGPTAIVRTAGAVEGEPGPAPAVLNARSAADQRAESAFLSRARPEPPQRPVTVVEIAPVGAWSGPDGLGRSVPQIRIELPPERAD